VQIIKLLKVGSEQDMMERSGRGAEVHVNRAASSGAEGSSHDVVAEAALWQQETAHSCCCVCDGLLGHCLLHCIQPGQDSPAWGLVDLVPDFLAAAPLDRYL